MHAKLLITLFVLIWPPRVHGYMQVLACDRLMDDETKKSDITFSYEDMKLGTKFSDFRKAYPNAVRQTDLIAEFFFSKYSIIMYTRKSKNAALVYYHFNKDVLVNITINYSPADIVKIGGHDTIVNTLVEKYGKPDSLERDKTQFDGKNADVYALWADYKADRKIELVITGDSAKVSGYIISKHPMNK